MLTLLLVIGIILLALWALGLITRRTLGGGAPYITCYCSYSCNSLAGICDNTISPTKDRVPRACPWNSKSLHLKRAISS